MRGEREWACTVAKIYQRVCKFARGRATCKRVVEKFASIARGKQGERRRGMERGEKKERGYFRWRRRMGEVEGIKRGYPFVVRHCFSSGTSWRMHHLAAFSTALFHSRAVSRILRCRNIGGTWPTGCCQNDVRRTSRPYLHARLSFLLLVDG